jgi:hypothetical protein
MKFLIIAGTSKAGTTSVFNYLAKHPKISPSEKETRFFLDLNYPLPSKWRHGRDDLERYFSQFKNLTDSGEKWRFEATPDYLYSPNTARVIQDSLGCVRLIFILREPVSRLRSFYRFGQSMGVVPGECSFDQYVERQRGICSRNLTEGDLHPAWQALPHGRYSTYLKQFLEVFARVDVHVAFYEDLAIAPEKVMKSICQFAGIEEQYFDNYVFKVTNKGVTVRNVSVHNVYWRGKQSLRSRLSDNPTTRAMLRRLGRVVDFVYSKANVTETSRITMSRATEEFLGDYYRDEGTHLRDLLGLEVPWSGIPTSAQVVNVS